MANKKPILLYQEGQQDQNHDVVQGTDVIDASHLAVLSEDATRPKNAIEVVEKSGDNFLYVKGAVLTTLQERGFTRLRTVSGAVSPHLPTPFAPHSTESQYLAAPLTEPRNWAKMEIDDGAGGEKRDYLVPVYDHEQLNKLEADYTATEHGFTSVTMANLGTHTVALVHEQDAQGETFKYITGDTGYEARDSVYLNVDVHLHLKNGEQRVHRGPVTLKDLGTLARTAGHYTTKVVLHAHDIAGQATPPDYQKATLVWATDKRLKDKVIRGTPTLFVDTRNTLILRWGENVAYDTTNKYVVIKF